MADTMSASNEGQKKKTSRFWLIAVTISILLSFVCVIFVLPKCIIYSYPYAIYPNAQNTNNNSGIELDATHTKLLIYSNSTFTTTDNLDRAVNWYTLHGWQEGSKTQWIGLGNSASYALVLNYVFISESFVSIIEKHGYGYTEIEVSTRIFIVH